TEFSTSSPPRPHAASISSITSASAIPKRWNGPTESQGRSSISPDRPMSPNGSGALHLLRRETVRPGRLIRDASSGTRHLRRYTRDALVVVLPPVIRRLRLSRLIGCSRRNGGSTRAINARPYPRDDVEPVEPAGAPPQTALQKILGLAQHRKA